MTLPGELLHNIGSGLAGATRYKRGPNQDVEVSKVVSFGDPDYPHATDQGPETLTQDKPVVTRVFDKTMVLGGWFEDVEVSPARAGASDTSNNLTTETSSMVARAVNPSASDGTFVVAGDTSYGFGVPSVSWSHTGSATIGGGTRQSDGASTSSSPANYYDHGTIEAWRWSGSWSMSLSGSASATFTNYRAVPNLNYDDTSPGYMMSYTDSLSISASSSVGGSFSGCTRTLVVKVPTCTPKLRNHPDNTAWHTSLPAPTTETFNPAVEHGGGGQTISVFPVGVNARSNLILRNRGNYFNLATSGSSYAYSGASPYNSGRSPSAGGVGRLMGASDAIMGSELNGASWNSVTSPALETDNAINFPGQYRVTWTPSWSSNASSAGWSGSELTGSTCEYELPPSYVGLNDPNEGPQPHPVGSIVGSLSLNVWVYAEPPTCAVSDFLFEINEPIIPRVVLSNPNAAPMWLDVADSTISRPPFSRTDSASTYLGQAVPANGDLVIEPTVDSIDHSGEFVLNWKIQTNMGAETWTTLGTPRPPQRSWFEDPEERIVDSLANACEVLVSKVVYRPFIKVFFGGLIAGGQFGASNSYSSPCGDGFAQALGGDRPAASYVAGHVDGNDISDARGSSVEYALRAHSVINGFYSVSQRASAPNPLKGLTLANTGFVDFTGFGGNYASKTCLANYWRGVEKLELETKPSTLELDLTETLRPNERSRFELPAGETLELGASAAFDNLKATLYVEGDVLIKADIIQNGGTWHEPQEIGYLSIIVKGNIDIASEVERIDAVLVAYPQLDAANNVVDGVISTCWHPDLTDPGSPDNIHFHTCDRQLVVNGALIAEKVLFGRVHASVKQEIFPTQPPSVVGPELFNASDRTRLGQIAMNYYTDLNLTHHFVDEVGYLLERNVLQDDDDCSPAAGQQFCPAFNEDISRGQFAIWLARALNGGQDPPAPPPGSPRPFTDVSDSDAFWPHVFYLANHSNVDGVVLGYDTGFSYPSAAPNNFSPGNLATRAWTAVLLAAAFDVPPTAPPTPLYFSDIGSYDSEIRDAINAVYAAEISNGYSSCVSRQITCLFVPDGTSRRQLAALLARAIVWEERGRTFFPTQKARNTKAAEVINLLPEYLIGTPELPFYAETLGKPAGSTVKPSNF